MSNDGLSREDVLAKVREHLSTELEVPLDGIERVHARFATTSTRTRSTSTSW